jgi:hypothetical protein
VWKALVDGKHLHFEIIGVNNQNFIMRDLETGSWWQQVTGEAIQGPLKGRRLELASSDEVSFGIWRTENPEGLVLAADELYSDSYMADDWDQHLDTLPPPLPAASKEPLPARELVFGVEVGEESKAYTLVDLQVAKAIVDEVGGTPVVLLIAADQRSVRCFERSVDGQVLDLFRQAESERFIDAQTGSTWEFSGRAIAGPLVGRELRLVAAHKDFWFDWKAYHPETRVYSAGL